MYTLYVRRYLRLIWRVFVLLRSQNRNERNMKEPACTYYNKAYIHPRRTSARHKICNFTEPGWAPIRPVYIIQVIGIYFNVYAYNYVCNTCIMLYTNAYIPNVVTATWNRFPDFPSGRRRAARVRM